MDNYRRQISHGIINHEAEETLVDQRWDELPTKTSQEQAEI